MPDFPLLPESASTFAAELDLLFGYLVAVTIFFSTLIGVLIVWFVIRYRRRAANEVPAEIEGNTRLELVWTGIPFLLVMSFFIWGSDLFFRIKTPPPEPLEIFVVGKQWMWKIQHQEGPREINELHIPVGRPIKLTMTSEDVIHSFYVPAFRVKQDALPGRYTTLWFEATQTGEYHLFCTEYCGTEHSLMGGKVIVMDPTDYQAWLGGGTSGESLAAAGERLYTQLGCNTCHDEGSLQRCPTLENLAGSDVLLANGQTVIADDDYLRESILEPAAKVTAGYEVIMPSYQGQVSEENILQLLAYIKSLGDSDAAADSAAMAPASSPSGEGPGQPSADDGARQPPSDDTTTGPSPRDARRSGGER